MTVPTRGFNISLAVDNVNGNRERFTNWLHFLAVTAGVSAESARKSAQHPVIMRGVHKGRRANCSNGKTQEGSLAFHGIVKSATLISLKGLAETCPSSQQMLHCPR